MVAPVGGLNLRDPISAMSPTDALALDNMMPKQQGIKMRKGWQVHTSTVTEPVKSIVAFVAPDPDDNKVFAFADGVIYDVTADPPVVSEASSGSTDDHWQFTQFSTPAETFLLAVNPTGGYWTYDSTDEWTQRTPAGLPANPRTVAVWKNRVWFTAQDDPNVYYLDDVDAIDGNATAFPMGSLLRHGGYVSALFNWTLDAGVGIDDYLVMVGTEGDVGVWQGTDPTSATTFGLKGVWYIGPVPKIGVYWTPTGGDVMVVSEQGVVPMSRLINGQFSELQPGPAAKVQEALSPLIRTLRDEGAWDVFTLPSEDALVIKLPADQYNVYRQFVMNITTGAWCTFTGLPMYCTTMLSGQLYFGREDGTTCLGLYGNTDGADINGEGGDYITADVFTAFQTFGTPANLKRFSLARPIFLASTAPSVKLRISTQYDYTNVAGSPAFNSSQDAKWDDATWNNSNWIGESETYQAWVGVTGMGYYGALRMKVLGLPGTTFTSAHVMADVGGLM
jgi:hypothetical protein